MERPGGGPGVLDKDGNGFLAFAILLDQASPRPEYCALSRCDS